MHAPTGPVCGGLLLIRGGAIGDFILSLPALRLLRRSFPGQRIEVLGTPGIVNLALHFRLADAVRRLEDPALARFFVPGSALDSAWSDYFSSFSVVVSHLFDPDGLFHDNLRRAGVRTVLRGPHRPVEGGPPAAEQLAAPLAELALFLGPGEAGEPIMPRLPGDHAPVIALHPGSGSPRKNWGLENWTRLATGLQRESGAHLLIVAGEAEATVQAALRTLMDSAGTKYTLADSLPLPELADRLAGCALFLGHDTGPAHLAAACGVPCVLVFGPTDPAVWAPSGAHVRVVRAENGSLAAVAPGEVLAAARSLGALSPGWGGRSLA